MLNPTPTDKLVDSQNRPYFLWDDELNMDAFRAMLGSPDRKVRAYWAGKLMRQAKPDDVFTFLRVAEIRELWDELEPYLGRTRNFWLWLIDQWR